MAVRGLTPEVRLAWIDMLCDLIATPDLDVDVERRAQWLLRGMQGLTDFDDLRMTFAAAAA